MSNCPGGPHYLVGPDCQHHPDDKPVYTYRQVVTGPGTAVLPDRSIVLANGDTLTIQWTHTIEAL